MASFITGGFKGRSWRISGFWREVSAMTAQIVLAMIALAIVITLLVQVVIPWLPVE